MTITLCAADLKNATAFKRKRKAQPEAVIQRAIVQNYRARAYADVFMFAVGNGGKRPPAEAAIMSGLGTVAGVPDLIFLRQGRMLALEVKTEIGKLSPNQAIILKHMEDLGATCHVSFGLNDALRWMEEKQLLRGRVA